MPYKLKRHGPPEKPVQVRVGKTVIKFNAKGEATVDDEATAKAFATIHRCITFEGEAKVAATAKAGDAS